MKKLYTLLFAFSISTVAVNAQNVITNGSFETWTTAEVPAPEGWLITLGANGGSVTQETTIVQNVTSSAKLTAPSGTGNNRVGFTDFAVTPGQTYTLSYWYYDQDNTARGRHWASFRDGAGALPSGSQLAVFQPDYTPNTTGWQQITVSGVAPVGATLLRLDFRVFQEQDTAGGGSVYVDNVVMGANLGVNQNAIAGLKVYPNPVTNGTLYIDSDNNAMKSVAIFDVLGKQVVKTTTEQAVNVSNLKGGVYIVKITEEGKTATRKLVIK